MSVFKDMRIVDNFYQTSSFFPMPTILVGTLCEDGSTSFGSYSLVSPYYIAGKDCYAMLLCCRNNSNTTKGLLRTGRCSLNFIPDKRKYFKEAVRLGFPGDTPQEKMKSCLFTLENGLMQLEHPQKSFPQVIQEAFQVFECTWMRELDNAQEDTVKEEYAPPYHDFNGITSYYGAHFILRVDKILLKPRYHHAIINGMRSRDFPKVPVDYGYRDSMYFWLSRFRRPVRESVPKRELDIEAVKFSASRMDDTVKFTDEACACLVRVPRVFLSTALRGCVAWAKEHGVQLITAEHMVRIQDKRSKEKSSGA
jgi:flavin reductase (DIM6/NTAB) family NADH-FMN oxidoreductase RutF